MTELGHSAEPAKNIRHKTLSAYYPVIQSLESLLSVVPVSLIKSTDTAKYHDTLSHTLCAISSQESLDHLIRRLKGAQRGNDGSQQEWINRILRDLGRIGGKNVLNANSGFSATELPINHERPHVENRYVHSPSSVLREIEWRLVRSRIGDEAFRLLLTHTSFFLPVGNNCYSQLSGEPIYDLIDQQTSCNNGIQWPIGKRKRSGKTPKQRNKRQKSSKIAKTEETKDLGNASGRGNTSARAHHLVEIRLPRQSIFYGQPHRLPNGTISVGLSPKHPLAKLAALEDITNLQYLKFVQSIFLSMFHTSRSEEDKLRVRGSLERLEGMMGMVKELVARFRKIDFPRLLAHCTKDDGNSKTGDATSIPAALEPVPQRQVCRFITSVFRQLLPATIMGSQHNHETLQSHARRFIKAKQYETTNLHSLMLGIRHSDITWLDLPNGQRSTASDASKRDRLIEDFVGWIFHKLLIPLIRNTFYVTETATTRYETVYYSHHDWQTASRPHFAELQRKLLKELDSNQAFFARQGELGVSAVRLIPKPTGFRPIVNLGKKIKRPHTLGISTYGSSKKESTANQILKGVHQVLSFEKDRHRAKLGASLMGTNEIFGPLQSLRKDLRQKHGTIPELYFVKMDIKAAFDTIKQDKMLDIVSALLDQNYDYCLMLYCLILPFASKASQGSARKLFKSRAVVDDHLATSFSQHAKEIAQPLRNAVIVDLVRRKQVTRAECLELLRTHIQNNVWQVGKKLYRQKTGIPQGSKISSLLCSFFYAHLENEYLAFLRKPGSRLLRYIDDFLFVTDDLLAARRFVETMSRGFPTYGAQVSKSKTLLSFECEAGSHTSAIVSVGQNGQALFPYCGFLIDTQTLEVMSDYPRMMTRPIRQSFALRSTRHRGANFVGWFSRQLENRNQVAYLDTLHNTVETVHFNIFLNFALTTMKVPLYFQGEEITPNRESLIAGALSASAEYTFIAGRARVRHDSRSDTDQDDHYGVAKQDFMFLARSAMIKVLSKKAARFKGIVELLQKDMRVKQRGHRYRELEERLVSTIERGWQAVKNAQY